jgi:hypothetical protein
MNTPNLPQSNPSSDDNVDSATRKGSNIQRREAYNKFFDSLPTERQMVHLHCILTWYFRMAGEKDGQTNSAAPMALEGGAE